MIICPFMSRPVQVTGEEDPDENGDTIQHDFYPVACLGEQCPRWHKPWYSRYGRCR
jgi:hypothetical protein